MLNVGNADAIIVELDKGNEKLVVLVDGGKGKEHAEKIINYFKTINAKPGIIICTHLDRDHIGGLAKIIEEYHSYIKAIWTHIPGNHNKDIKSQLSIDSRAFLKSERRELLIASLQDLEDFVKIAEKYGLKDRIFEPFSDKSPQEISNICKNWNLSILGPSKDFYESLLPKFRNFQEQKAREIASQLDSCGSIGQEGPDTPENESSLIFQIYTDGKKYLFTGDAGLQAFENIDNKLEKIYWVKIPHHGSKKSLNSEILDRLSPTKAFISAKGEAGHPDDNLVKCLRNKGTAVHCTGKEGKDLIE
jgi:beta-lactamase superfamily II metal-dependent hydrolase